jgi:hypothetical protein
MTKLREITCKSAITWHSDKSCVRHWSGSIRSFRSMKYLLSSLRKSTAARATTKSYSLNPCAGGEHDRAYCYAEYQNGIIYCSGRAT